MTLDDVVAYDILDSGLERLTRAIVMTSSCSAIDALVKNRLAGGFQRAWEGLVSVIFIGVLIVVFIRT